MANNQDDVIEVAVVHVNDGVDQQINTYQFQKTDVGATSDADLLDDVSDLVQAIYVVLQGIITVRNVLLDVVVRNLTQSLLVGSTDAGAYVGGTAPGDAWPNGAAALTYFKTNIPRVILKKYWPSGVVANISPGGNPDATVLAQEAFAAALLLSPFVLTNSTLVYGHDSPKTLAFEVPLTGHIPLIMAYQRRRKAGTGS